MIEGLTIDTFARGLRARAFSAAEVTAGCLERIAAGNDRLNAFIRVMGDEALRQARVLDQELAAGRDRGPLHGVPISIKDLFDVSGTPTTAASRVRDGHMARTDARVIADLRQAGAVLIGKTNLHEFAFGTTNEDSAYGPARNPHDPSRSPGGSSGGSAASVAAGMALATVGSDTGGSVRIPAAACGIVGLKPSYGEISLGGVVPLSRTLDHVGPLAQTVTDTWTVYRAMTGGGAGPMTATAIGGVRIAIPRRYFCDVLDDDVRAGFESAVDAIRAGGATVEDIDIPHAALAPQIYMHISFGEAAAYHGATLETMADKYTPAVRQRLELARHVLAEDYVRALSGREVLRREVDAALTGRDALVLPTLPIPPPAIGASTVVVSGKTESVRNLMLRLTQLFNLTGNPAVSLPCGRTPAGLPCGLQLVGFRGETESLLSLALAVESRIGV